jgi:glycosyltransferase involved in cell wall biosynthesis
LGCEVDVLTHGDTISRDIQDSITVSRFPIIGNGRLLNQPRGPIKELHKFLAANRWDIIFMHCWQAWNTNCLLDYFAEMPGTTKLVLVSHGVSTNSNFLAFPHNLIRRLLWLPYRFINIPKYLRQISKLVVLWGQYDDDRFIDNVLAHRIGIPVSVIPNVARYNPSAVNRPSLRFTDEELAGGFLLSVGNYSNEKNELFVLEAYKQSRMINVPLIFVGHQLNSYSAKLEKLACEWGLNNVLFCERLAMEEIDWLYKHALLFLCGSKTECQPMVILDCLASNTACISTDVGCVSSLAGVKVVSTVHEMASQIQVLVLDVNKREIMINQGQILFRKIFSLSSIRAKWDSLLKELLIGN